MTDEISDHDLVYTVLNIRKQKFEQRYKFIRNEKLFDLNKYINDFSQLPLSIVFALDDPNDQVNVLNQLITECINRHAPLRKVKLTRPPAPWMSNLNITSLQRLRENQRKLAQQTDSVEDWNKYRETRNRLKKEIKQTKKNFFKKALLSKNSKEVWKTIHRILKPNYQRIKADPKALNDHFTSLATKVTGKGKNDISNVQSFIQTLPSTNINSFKIEHTNYEQVDKILKSLRNDTSTGFDTIPAKFIKPVRELIASPLTNIINNSIDKSIFPNQWKIARICPIPKVNNPSQFKNYSPISVLPILSKVYEKVILIQLSSFIDQQKLYKTTQSGYRKGHSCITLLLKLRNDIQKAMNNTEVTLSVFADYSKAFDTVDHQVLIEKLHSLNFSKSTLLLLLDYLSERKQFIQIDDKFSPHNTIQFGVPQGSILGPILFNIYVSDLSDNAKSKCLQFADDTTFYNHCKVKDIPTIATSLKTDIESIKSWSKEANLVFNGDKTKVLLFSTSQLSSRHKLDNDNTFNIDIDNKNLERKTTWKVLGIHLNQHLDWKEQISSVIASGYATLRTLRRIKRLTPFHVRKSLAECLVLSKINYGIELYKNAPEYLKVRLQRLQKSTAGYVLGKYAKQIDVVNLKWLPIHEQIDFSIVKLAFKSLYDESFPEYLQVKFAIVNNQFRSSTNKDCNSNEICRDKNTFENDVAKIFNELPRNIRTNDDMNSFFKDAKIYYFDRALARSL